MVWQSACYTIRIWYLWAIIVIVIFVIGFYIVVFIIATSEIHEARQTLLFLCQNIGFLSKHPNKILTHPYSGYWGQKSLVMICKNFVYQQLQKIILENPIYMVAGEWGGGWGMEFNHRWLVSKSTAFLEASWRSTFQGTDTTRRVFCRLLHCSFLMWNEEWYK